MSYNIKDMVKDNKRVKFCYYRHGELFYKTECGFMFPVPIDDTGDGTFLDEDKAMFFMRYIRKQVEAIKRDNSDFGSLTDVVAMPLTDDERDRIMKAAGIINEDGSLHEDYNSCCGH